MMKTNQSFSRMVILMMALCLLGVFALESFAKQGEGTVLIIKQNIPQNPNAPRTPVVNPFFAQLEDTYVLLGSTSPCGVVAVSLVSTSGDNYSANFDTDDWTIIIPVSGNPGHYTLTLVTESGAVFEGEFDI